jgi:hypothetical protein
VDFLSDDPRIFSMSRGYAFDPSEIEEVNHTLIEPFLDHMLEVICGGEYRIL